MRHRLVSLMVILLAALIPVSAQLNDEGNTFTLQNGLIVTAPDGWTIANSDGDERDSVALDDGRTGLNVLLYFPETLADSGISTAEDALALHYDTTYTLDLETRDIEEVTLEGVAGIRYASTVEADTDEYEQIAYAFLLPDEYVLLALIYPMRGSGLRITSEAEASVILEAALEGVDSATPPPDATPDPDETGADVSDLTEYTFGYLTTLTLPEGWQFEEINRFRVVMTDGDTRIEIAFYTPHRAGLKGRSAEDLLRDYFATINNAENNPVDESAIEDDTLAEQDAVRYETRYSPTADEEYEMVVYAALLPNGAGIVAAFYPVDGSRLAGERAARSVVEDFVTAQPALIEELDLGYAITFETPAGWAIDAEESDSVDLDNGTTALFVQALYPSTVADRDLSDAMDVLDWYMEIYYPDVEFSRRDAEMVELGRLEAARVTFEFADENGDVYPHVIVALLLEDGERALVGDILPVQPGRLVGEAETVRVLEEIAARIGDIPDEFEFVDGTVFEFPRDWNYYSSTQNYFVNMDDNVTGMLLDMYTPEELEGNARDPEDLMEWYQRESLPGSQLDEVTIGGVDGVRYITTGTTSDGEDYDRIFYAFILDNDYGLIVGVYPLYGQRYDEDDALPLIEDFLEQRR